MALGSNSLGLLFKVGVDAGDAQKAFQQLMATNKEFAKGVEEGMRAEAQAFAGANTALKATTESARQLGVTFNQVRVAIGQLIGGLTLVRAFREISQSIEEIGTRSKEDFDTLQKQVESAGGHITELQRNIAQELVGAFDRLKGASAGFMAEVIETSGPALINLLKDIADWLGRLRPLASAVGDDLADTFNRINALGRTISGLQQREQPGVGQGILEALFPPLAAKRALDQMNEFDKGYAEHLKNIQDENKKFVASPAGTDSDPAKIKKARQDITDAALEQAKAEHSLSLIRQEAAVADREINADQAKGFITQEEGARRRLAVLAELQKAELAALDARQRAVKADPRLLPNQRASQLDDIETQRAAIRLRAGDAEDQERRRTIDADQKLHDALTAHFVKLKQQWLDYAQFVHDQTDLIVQEIARQAQPVPAGGGVGQIPGLPSDEDIQKGLDDAFKHYESFFQRLKDGFAGAADVIRDRLAKAIEDLPVHIIDAFTNAFENLLDTFIKTGHTGPAVMKQFVSQVLQSIALLAAQLAALAFGYALLMLAFQNYHDAALAAAAGIALTALAIGLGYASRAVAPSSASSSAGAGTGFGGAASEAPGTVTINQGAGSGLGIQLQILNALQNITTAPPGDILQRGADQNPMAVGQANNEAARRDGSVSREFLQISGLRTA
jgi:hypothetical protein